MTTAKTCPAAINNGGYIELQNGTRYTCQAAGGCEVRDGVVTRGTIVSGAAAAGGTGRACTAGLVVNPGGTCTYKGYTFTVSSSGRGSIAFYSAGTSIDARGSTINGVVWNFHATKNSGSNSWTIHTANWGREHRTRKHYGRGRPRTRPPTLLSRRVPPSADGRRPGVLPGLPGPSRHRLPDNRRTASGPG